MRLDIYIVKIHPGVSRSHAKRLIEEGHVRLNGHVCRKPSHGVRDADTIEAEFVRPAVSKASPEDIPLDILYEDSDIIVINKPAGMVVHPAAGNPKGTLVNALLHHCRDLSGIGGVERPGIVHRLDKGTSGIMAAAKNDFAHKRLSDQFKARTVEKRYYALVYGRVPKDEGGITLAIGRHPSERKKMSVKARGGRIAETFYKVRKRFGSELTLLDIRLGTGRTHQIRVHFSHMGHPLIGDDLYGGRAIKRLRLHKDDGLYNLIKGFTRPFLHSYKLEFEHPRTGRRLAFTAEMPQEMRRLLDEIDKAG